MFTPKEKNKKSPVPEILSNSELAAALLIWLKKYRKENVDVLLMMNCWMMNLHTMYAMKEIVSCLVAPQTDIGNPGYNYASILTCINQPAHVPTPQHLATHCVTSRRSEDFRLKVKSMKLSVTDTIDNCLVFAMDLQAIDADGKTKIIDNIFAALKEFISNLHGMLMEEDATDSVKYIVRYVRALMYDFTRDLVHLIDINNYIALLGGISNKFNYPLRPLFSNLANIVQEFSQKSQPGGLLLPGSRVTSLYLQDGVMNYATPVPTGCSIFFRLFHTNSLGEKIQYSILADKLLNDYLQEWNEILTEVFGI